MAIDIRHIIYPKLLESLRTKILGIFQKHTLPRWLVFAFDNFAVFLSFFIAYLLRFNLDPAGFDLNLAAKQAFLSVSIYVIFELIFRSYSGLIRHTTIIDIFTVFLATSSSLMVLLGLTFLNRETGFSEILNIPISVILIHYGAITLLLFFVRIIIKIGFQVVSTSGEKKKVLIFGAGDTGVIVKRLINSDIKSGFQIYGFIDYNKKLQGKKLNGINVYNPKIINSAFIKKNKIETLIFAIKNISPKNKSELIRTAIDLGLEVLETPSVDKWLNGQLQMRQLQNVKIKDLLGRDPIKLNMDLIGKELKGKNILVTGAAGSIGSEIVRQLSRFKTGIIVLVDQAETPMFHFENELRDKFSKLQYKVVLADVTNPEKIELIFKKYHPEIIFHAAAYKHVPMLEENPHEAFRVNVGGTKILTDMSVKYDAGKFVMISTDKSVNPSSIMGTSKRICEMIVQSRAFQPGIKTQFVITRFGNVLGSNGSVIPIFTKQIEEGGPIKVTHPDITRYFMTIPEACELVLEAGFMGNGGEIFVFDMGKPIKIADLAQQMIQLSGLVPGKDIQIIYTGLRPGEKLYEELLSDKENLIPTYNPKIRIAQVENADFKLIRSKINTLLKGLYRLSEKELIDIVTDMVPEYKSKNIGNQIIKKSSQNLNS